MTLNFTNDIGDVENTYKFNKDAFIVVGTPTISDDGIASGFSTSNYLQLTYPFKPNDKSWEIKIRVNCSDVSYNNTIIGQYGNDFYNSPDIHIQSGHFKYAMPAHTFSHTSMFSFKTGAYNVLPNTDYWIKFGFTGTFYYFDYSLDGISYTREDSMTYETTETIYPATEGFCIGFNKWGASSTEVLKGSIDLKQFSITVEGVEVFSGKSKVIPTLVFNKERKMIYG